MNLAWGKLGSLVKTLDIKELGFGSLSKILEEIKWIPGETIVRKASDLIISIMGGFDHEPLNVSFRVHLGMLQDAVAHIDTKCFEKNKKLFLCQGGKTIAEAILQRIENQINHSAVSYEAIFSDELRLDNDKEYCFKLHA